jgi:alkylation response protein AidB-like acyl-CoA dehydrogenase
VLNFGSEEIKAKVVPEVLSGRKFICLAISEAHAGSDVMGLQTTAVKSEDGKEWIINGKNATSTLVKYVPNYAVLQAARNGLPMERKHLRRYCSSTN